MNTLIIVSCIIFILLVMFAIIVIKIGKIIVNQDKLHNKIDTISQKQNKFDAFLIPTYNNSIRIAKKFGVYYCYNKEDYEQHKAENKFS